MPRVEGAQVFPERAEASERFVDGEARLVSRGKGLAEAVQELGLALGLARERQHAAARERVAEHHAAHRGLRARARREQRQDAMSREEAGAPCHEDEITGHVAGSGFALQPTRP